MTNTNKSICSYEKCLTCTCVNCHTGQMARKQGINGYNQVLAELTYAEEQFQKKNPTTLSLKERIKNELTKRIVDANFETITITMKKHGDVVNITCYPDFYTTTEAKTIDDIVACFVHSDDIIDRFFENDERIHWLDCVADLILNFDTLRKEYFDDKYHLEQFFQKNIAGHTHEELKDGNRYSSIIYDDWKDKNISLTQFEDSYPIATLDDTKDETYIRTCLTLSHNFSHYSDWHKDIYNYRPRFQTSENDTF